MAARRRRTKPVNPVRVNAALLSAYRRDLQKANTIYKAQVDKRVKTLLRQIDALDRTRPGAFAQAAEKLQTSIDNLQRNLDAANRRSAAAVDRFVARADRENRRRTVAVFSRRGAANDIDAVLNSKASITSKNIRRLADRYKADLDDVNRDYSDRVQIILQARLGGSRADSRKALRNARSIVTRRIKNTASNQAHNINASLNRTRQAALGAKGYMWRTRDDEKVRNSHAELHNTEQRWAARPQPLNRHPGEDFNCRCDALPIVEV